MQRPPLSNEPNRAEMVPPTTARRALLERIYAFMAERLADPGLSPGTIAAAHHISVRYLHKLFETQPSTVAGWIRQRRLDQCRRDLLNPALLDRPVSAIGNRAGFASPTHFTRAFRAAYGLPPAKFRATATTSPAPAGPWAHPAGHHPDDPAAKHHDYSTRACG